MDDIFRTIEVEEAKVLIGGFEYALLYNIEGIELVRLSSDGCTEGAESSIDYDGLLKECYEARFFDRRQELRLFRDGTEGVLADWKKAVIISDSSDGECIKSDENGSGGEAGEKDGTGIIIRQDKKYELAKRYRKNGKAVIIRQYLVPDDDGQMCVKATRLVGIEV